MSDAASSILSQISATTTIAQSQVEIQGQMQDPIFYQLAHAKNRRIWQLIKENFGRPLKTVWISHNIKLLADAPWAGDVRALSKDFFGDGDASEVRRKCGDLKHSVVILNNNDAHEAGGTDRLARWVARCPDTVFLAWDWDNYH